MEEFEDTELVASEHDRLISAVSKLDKTQHITEPTRNEPTVLNSEFNLVKRTSKLKIDNVVKILGDTAGHVKTSKKLLKSQSGSKVLPKPLEKPQIEKIKRATGYTQTKQKVGRWDPVVARSRTVDYVSFPLKQVSSKLQPTHEFLSKLKTKSELELQLDEVDPPAIEEKDVEEEPLYPMSYEEMVEHRQHLAKVRAQESYRAAKAKQRSKIKSKKYHRVLKKERLKQQLKEFEELQKTNPEEALQKLEAIEKSRALERHTLRHKSTGKWAKNKMIRAKYDKEARQQIAEQLAVSRSLTQKTKDVESSDDDDVNNETIPDIALTQDPMNPWMMQQKDKSNIDSEFNFGYKKYLQSKRIKQKDDDSDSEDDKKEDNQNQNDAHELPNSQLLTLKERINKLVQEAENESQYNLNNEIPIPSIEPEAESQAVPKNKKSINNDTHNINESSKQTVSVTNTTRKSSNTGNITMKKSKKPKKENLVATSIWNVESVTGEAKDNYKEEMLEAFESLENELAQKVEQKLKSLRKNIKNVEKLTKSIHENEKKRKREPVKDNLEYLKLKNQKPKVIIDEELMQTSSKSIPEFENVEKPVADILARAEESKQTNDDIDPSRFIEVKAKFLNTALPGEQNVFDELDDDEQVVPRVNIEEVFEEDDVVASFRKEKEDEINKDKPEEINLTLPGWGAWGGKGVKAPKRKRNRFITKLIPKMPRRDENKGDIIIKEYKDPKLSVHKVKELPYPFRSVSDYEASIRLPLGNTFIPEKAHKKLIKPSVITKAGTIIEPMDEDELLTKKNKNFKTESIIKIINKD